MREVDLAKGHTPMTTATRRRSVPRWMALTLGGAALASLAGLAQAQVVVPPSGDAGALRQRQLDEEARRREEERVRQPIMEPLRREGLPPAPAAPDPATATQGPRIQVERIEFDPSEILSRAELEAVARDYQGRQVALGELQQLVARVNALYRARNVVTAQAVVPPQDVSQGVVRVRLVEGRIGQLNLRGNASTDTDYIVGRLGLRSGELVDLDRLERALLRFNRSQDVQLRAELRPGSGFGLTDLQVEASEPPRHDARITLDNLGSESTGAWRVVASYTNRSLAGLRDEFSVSATQAEGLRGGSIAYGLPFNHRGGRLTLGATEDRTQIVNGALAPLFITGASGGRTLALRQPVLTTPRWQLDLTGGARTRYSDNYISGIFLQRTTTRDHHLGAEAQWFGDGTRWLGSWSRHWGEERVLTPRALQIDRVSMRVDHDLGQGRALRASFSWQGAQQRGLPANEQFSIGGDGSVRGFPASATAGDTGRTLNLEWHHPIGRAQLGSSPAAASGFLFYDRGDVKPLRPPGTLLPEREHLNSVGWGMNAQIDRAVTARLVFGYRINRLPFDPGRYQIHFQLVTSLL